MATYFGNQTYGEWTNTGGDLWVRNKTYVTGFSCPGTGDQTIKELSAYARLTGASGNLRVAIFDTSHNLVAQGNGEVAITGAGSWQGHMAQANITPNPCNLTGGVQYDLAVTFDGGSNYDIGFYTGGSGDGFTYNVVDYTEGFPATLADGNNINYYFAIRCGVDAAAGGRTTKNTVSNPLGINYGMGFGMPK